MFCMSFLRQLCKSFSAVPYFFKVISHLLYPYFKQTLYKLLLNTLYERGVNNEFAKDLLDMSTTIEHKEYVDFLQDLKGFFSAK